MLLWVIGYEVLDLFVLKILHWINIKQFFFSGMLKIHSVSEPTAVIYIVVYISCGRTASNSTLVHILQHDALGVVAIVFLFTC